MKQAGRALALAIAVIVGGGFVLPGGGNNDVLRVNGFIVDPEGLASRDVSGIACKTSAADENDRFCVFVDDETRAVQFGLLHDHLLKIDPPTEVVGADGPAQAIGAPPGTHHCADAGGFRDIDGEAVAFSQTHVFVVGSHGCGRNSNRFRPSSFVLARAPLNGDALAGPFEVSYRLGALLQGDAALAPFFTQSLNNGNGLNIEGMTVAWDRLLFGLRAPVSDGWATIVSAPIDALFSDGPAPALGRISVPLGEGLGIRELTVLPDGRFLLLAGPAQEQARDYEIVLTSPQGSIERRETLPRLNDNRGNAAKAEGMAILRREDDTLVLILAYDGLPNGGLRYHRFRLR